MSILYILVSANLVVLTLGFSIPSIHLGRCPSIEVQQNFDAASYMGLWYEQAGYNTKWVEGGDSRCVAAEYQLNTTTGVVSVHNMAIDNSGNRKTGINGTATLDDPSKKEGKLTVTFKVGGFNVNGKYWVLGTDYTNYTVVYACENLVVFHSYTVWFLGREKLFSSNETEMAFFNMTNDVLRTHNLDPAIMTKSDQTNCNF